MDTIRWGIIGCGDVCEKKSGPAFYKIEHSELKAVMRRDAVKVRILLTDIMFRNIIPMFRI